MLPALLLATTLHLPVEHHTLDNGLQVVLLVDRRAPIIASELTVRVGAAEDSVSGIAHLIEHVMFEGEYDGLLAEAGGESNAWTGHDWTVYTAAAPADALERLLYIESRRLADPLAGVSDDDLDNQIAVVLTERSIARGGGRGDRALTESLYPPGHPLHGPVLGDPDAIGEVSRADIAAFVDAWYQPENATLVLGGDIDPQEALARITHWFAPLTSKPSPPRAVASLSPRSGRRVLTEDTPPTLMLAWPTVPRGHPDEGALDLLADALSQALRERVSRGRLDSGQAWTENGRLGGRLVVSVGHPRRGGPALLREAERALRTVLGGVSPQALAAAQDRWRMHYVRAAQPLEARVRYAGSCLRAVGVADCLEDEIRTREALRPADLGRVAAAYLTDARRIEVIVHPQGHRSLPGAEAIDPL